MSFESILFRNAEGRPSEERLDPPAFFPDLNLDQMVAAVTAGREEYDLRPFFHAPLREVDDVLFRHEVMRDLELPTLLEGIGSFASDMRRVRDSLARAEKGSYQHQRERWFLDAVDLYGATLTRLAGDLSAESVCARGLVAFRTYLAEYISSERFNTLLGKAKQLKADLSAIRYNVFIRGARVEVRRYTNEADYSADVEATFGRFQQGAGRTYEFEFDGSLEMNHIEAQILDGVASLHQTLFSALAAFCTENKDFLDAVVLGFDREIQFYVAWLEYVAPLRRAGLELCYPAVSRTCKEIYDYRGFDIALARKLVGEGATVVCNDLHLKDPERIVVVSGPNQGGKTTFARMFGQLHYLASLGCLVPGAKAQLFLPDRYFTHFERQERMTNLRGKLEDDMIRIHEILEAATPRSVIVINEIFSSTALQDAISLSKKIATEIMGLDALCVWVTFIDELSSISEKTVSMVSTVMPDDPARRTFEIVRRPADGLTYAMSLAEKFRLTHDMVAKRLQS
jgi:DNA mismatch repair ATPase MutS